MHSPDVGNGAHAGAPHVVALGLNHASAQLAVCEGMAFSDCEARTALARLGATDGVGEMVLLSTCNRTELYFVALRPDDVLPCVRARLDDVKGVTVMRRPEWTYTYLNTSAAEHLFRVASGLDSLLVGEAQVFSQVKQAYDLACEAQQAGVVMNRLFQAALHAGKRARTETDIGAGAVSTSSAAVGLAEKVFGSLGDRAALLVGAGETARLAAEHLVERGIGRLTIANRTRERAEALAARFGARLVPFADRVTALPDADILISATSAPDVLFQRADVAQAMRQRPRRSLLVLDLAVPRDVDPVARQVDNVFLYDIDALKVMVEQNLVRRRKEIPRVEALIREELAEFTAWYESLAVTPLIRDLREHVEAIRREQIERYGHQFSAEDRERLDRFTRTLLNRVLHQPLIQLRSFSHDARWGPLRMDAVRELFGLEKKHGESHHTDRDAR